MGTARSADHDCQACACRFQAIVRQRRVIGAQRRHCALNLNRRCGSDLDLSVSHCLRREHVGIRATRRLKPPPYVQRQLDFRVDDIRVAESVLLAKLSLRLEIPHTCTVTAVPSPRANYTDRHMTEKAWNRCKDLKKQCYNARVIFHMPMAVSTIAVLLGLVFTPQAQAIEPTSVQAILADPSAYHLRQAGLQGTVRQVHPLDPYETPSGTRCYGAYLFQLEDDTGIIAVAVPGLCGVPLVKDPDVQDGDRVFVEATIQTPSHGGYALSLKGLKITTEQEGTVQAVATRITPLLE